MAAAPISVQIAVVPAIVGARMVFGVDPANPTWAIQQHDDSQLFKSTSAIATKIMPIEGLEMIKSALENVPPLSAPPSQPSMVQLLGGGGQAAVPKWNDTAVYYRDALFIVQYDGYWTAVQDEQPTIDWVVNLRKSMLPYASGAYVNYVDTALGPDWLEQYYGGNLPRLREVKKKYDPHNFFNFPQSIPPA
jgi:FAD/FMN-containing dehydrogenase